MLNEEDLTDADEKILDALKDGPRTKGAIVDATMLHRNTVGNRLDVLEAGDAIKCIHDRTALYELTNDPRDDAERTEKATVPIEEYERLQRRVDELEAQMADIDINQARTLLDRVLEELPDDAACRSTLEEARSLLEVDDD